VAWLQELAKLAALSAERQPSDAVSSEAAAPADQLAGWLLRNADLDGAASEVM
jgi:hypothetical protein